MTCVTETVCDHISCAETHEQRHWSSFIERIWLIPSVFSSFAPSMVQFSGRTHVVSWILASLVHRGLRSSDRVTLHTEFIHSLKTDSHFDFVHFGLFWPGGSMCIINQSKSAAWIAMVTQSLYLCTASVSVTSDLQRRPAASPASCSRLFIATDQSHLLHSSVTINSIRFNFIVIVQSTSTETTS